MKKNKRFSNRKSPQGKKVKIICPEKEDTEKPFGGKLKSCRICLLSGRSKDCNEYVSPCKCQGSLKYVHQECLKFWIQTRLKQKLKTENTFECEICKFPMEFQTSKKYVRNSCDKIKKEIDKNRFVFIVLTILLIFNLLTLIMIGVLVGNGTLDISNVNSFDPYFIIIISSLVPIILIVLVYKYVFRFLVSKSSNILKIKKRDVPKEQIDVGVQRKENSQRDDSFEPLASRAL